jgi:hypothetical protein
MAKAMMAGLREQQAPEILMCVLCAAINDYQ